MNIIKLDTGKNIYAAHLMGIQAGVDFGFLVLTTIADTLGQKLETVLPALEKITSGGDPKEAMPLLLKILGSLDPARLSLVSEKAFSGEVFANDQKLSNHAVMEKHFVENRGEYFPVLAWLVWSNVHPFLHESGAAWKAVMGAPESEFPTT
jgi:hypothetical protein